MISRLLKVCYHCTVYTIGVCVLLAAVTVTLIRLVLPDIGIYRGEIEAWVSNYMDFPIVIHSLDASWQGWIPELYRDGRPSALLNHDFSHLRGRG